MGRVRQTANRYKLSDKELAMADLISCGWDDEDAYAITVATGFATWTKSAIKAEIARIKTLQGFVKRLEDNDKGMPKETPQKPQNAPIVDDEKELIKLASSKEQMLLDLQKALNGMIPGTKEWMDIKKMIIDVTRMKQDEVQQEDTTIHYFLPVAYPTSCEDCLLKR